MKGKLHFHLRGKERVFMGTKIPAGEKSPKFYMTRDEADKALFEQIAKFPDLYTILEVVPCITACKQLKD